MRQADAPAVAAKLMALLRCDARNLHVLSLLRYTAGQYFRAHCDEDNDGVAAPFAGFDASHRVCTCFVYLNDVAEGGSTHFRRINVDVRPKKGAAVIFFPGFMNGELDTDALHAGMPAVDTKWVSQVWIRQSYREDGQPSSPVRR